ncbi:MAG: winged helix-turn-helix transcriptional regulator [Chloroflexi bacterium]|nr:winged helix-turn-helix transcriptional regulator [Chloroflexota bacterium]
MKQVSEARELRGQGLTMRVIAERLGVSPATAFRRLRNS